MPAQGIKKMEIAENLVEIVVNGIAEGNNDSSIYESLFKEGVAFSDLKKTFDKIVKDNELRMTPKERKEQAATFLEGYVPEDVNNHLAKISALQDHLECSTAQAGGAMRSWAKANDIELPRVPKSESNRVPGFGGNHKILADYVLANKDCTRDDLAAFAKANIPLTKGGKENWGGYALDIWNAMIFAKEYVGEETQEVEEAA